MKRKDYFVVLFFVAIFIASFLEKNQQQQQTSQLSKQMETALLDSGSSINQNTLQNGYVKVSNNPGTFSQQQLQAITESKTDKDHTYTWNWGSKNNTATTASATGLDDKHHFANSYLIGYMPFYTDKHWVPLYVLATRKTYQLDHLQYTGLQDIWQNSRQAFKLTRGDCEDHAIALADWLISLGVDARVAMGKFKNEGHAWVIVFKDGKEYLLEATDKKTLTRWSKYRLAGTQVDYHPKYQFNRDHFWINTGSEYTVKYSGKNWKQTSTFHGGKQSKT